MGKQRFVMMLILLVGLAAVASAQAGTQLNIRAGVSQLQLGTLQQATYSILFNAGLPDSVYNSMVSVSYATALDATNSLVIFSACPNMTQAKMDCSVLANSNNQNNIVYVSYVASDIGSLLVGTYSHTFSFMNTNSISETLTFKPAIDSNYINSNNALQVGFYPIISGVNTLDPDFSLTINDKQFDSLALSISIAVTLNEVHAKNVTVYFGYLLYDVSVITVSRMVGQQLSPQNVADGYIYGISGVNAQKLGGRRLQLVPSPPKSPSGPPPIAAVNAVNAVNVKPLVRRHLSATTTNSSALPSPSASSYITPPTTKQAAPIPPKPSPAAFIPSKQSSLASTLRTHPEQLKLTPKSVNSSLFETVKQPDGVIDANTSAMSTLQTLKFLPAQSEAKALTGIDNQLFNNLFSTNGFVIITTADDVDQVYYYEVSTPVQRGNQMLLLPAPSAPAQVFYEEVITNAEPAVVCGSGVAVGKPKRMGYIQEKMVLSCVRCAAGMYLDLLRRTCQAFPIITNFLNQVDQL